MAAMLTGESRKKLATLADAFAVAIAVSLPWSTSATAMLVGLWFFALVPVLRWDELRREILTPAGGLPVLLVLLGVVGMLWADVTLLERWKGLDSFLKLLAIPLLLVQFHRSGRGTWVFAGYLFSCIALLVVTSIVIAVPPLSATFLHFDNVIVKNAATQSGEFVICIFGLLYLMMGPREEKRWPLALACAAVILAMLANIFYFSTGRTALVTIFVLFVLLVLKIRNVKTNVKLLAAAIVLGIIAWMSSPYLRERTEALQTEAQRYEKTNARTSTGERLEFWKKSAEFLRQAPVIGHGTGSIRTLFEKAAAGQTGAAGVAAANPHNQTLAVGIQLGAVGIAVLWAMWAVHLMLFRGGGLAAWVGLV
ncbi:MAG TPA: O-antigen ligase family protein, partial [Pseudolabrys sp.]|nr:O-antigen ligase family protein [Pseudolabrys sp.]